MSDRYSILTMGLRLYRLLRRGWSTRRELASLLGVHERTVRRLTEALVAAGITVQRRWRHDSRSLEYHARRLEDDLPAVVHPVREE